MSNPAVDDVPPITRDLLLSQLTSGNAVGAEEIVANLLASGVSPVTVIRHVLGPALARVGQLWQEGALSIAGEHQATSIVEGLLQMTLARVDSPTAGTRVWLTGTEGEWHTMPARLVAATWRCLGWQVVALTPSLPAEELRTLALGESTRVAGVSCSLPSNLVPAWQVISVLRECGFRTVVGGNAFGAARGLAETLGADAHIDDPIQASETLAMWVQSPTAGPRLPTRIEVWEELAAPWADLPRIVEAAVVVAGELAGVAIADSILREDLTLIARTAMSAALAGSPAVLASHMRWYHRLLDVNGFDSATGRSLLWSLERALPDVPSLQGVLQQVEEDDGWSTGGGAGPP